MILGIRLIRLTFLQEAIKFKPNYTDAYTGMGVSLKETGRKQEAIACFQRVCNLKPHCALSYGNLAGEDLTPAISMYSEMSVTLSTCSRKSLSPILGGNVFASSTLKIYFWDLMFWMLSAHWNLWIINTLMCVVETVHLSSVSYSILWPYPQVYPLSIVKSLYENLIACPGWSSVSLSEY